MPMTSSPCNLRDGDYFDEHAADHAVRFIETYCSHVKGHTGRFILEPWQKDDIIRPLFGWKREDGRRKYRTCYVEIPRKNGKSSLTAAIALYLLTGLNERGAEIISAAGDAAQARIVFETATGMVLQSRTLPSMPADPIRHQAQRWILQKHQRRSQHEARLQLQWRHFRRAPRLHPRTLGRPNHKRRCPT